MDTKLTNYRRIIKQVLTSYLELINRSTSTNSTSTNEENDVVFDEERDHYFVQTIGWDKTGRVSETTIYVRLRHSKFWIEIDWTEHGIANDLLVAGVPKDDIVLAFHHPDLRPLTEFAVA